jgi:hypothetical protein
MLSERNFFFCSSHNLNFSIIRENQRFKIYIYKINSGIDNAPTDQEEPRRRGSCGSEVPPNKTKICCRFLDWIQFY